MDLELLDELLNNINNTNKSIIKEPIFENLFYDINNKMMEINELLKDYNENNIENLEKKQKELFIENKSMEPFIKYLIVYNTFLKNVYT